MRKDINGGVTAAQGYRAAGIHAGIKKKKKDLAIVVSDLPAAVAGVFTTNKVVAAPLVVDRMQMEKSPRARAIVVNSGNANACTGEQGMNDAWRMVEAAARALGVARTEVLVSSTGVIGKTLPMDKVVSGVSAAVPLLSRKGHADAAEAILTTDTFVKEAAVSVRLGGVDVVIGGMAKGSGMIAPNMATMLAFVTTDARISPAAMRDALRLAADRSFNRISVDGDMSTNDMVLLLANGAAGGSEITSTNDPSFAPFYDALEYVLTRLSKMIVVDGEGATKFVEVRVVEASTEQVAAQAARAIANSNLVKTAIHGEDANWGRILAAVGYSGIEFNPADTEISFGTLPILKKNYAVDFSEVEAKKVLAEKEIVITVSLHQGNASAAFWTCDLSKAYVDINANYRT
jgi:glutamate N-acetyltransferase / amino-acid N-acetyltransferase